MSSALVPGSIVTPSGDRHNAELFSGTALVWAGGLYALGLAVAVSRVPWGCPGPAGVCGSAGSVPAEARAVGVGRGGNGFGTLPECVVWPALLGIGGGVGCRAGKPPCCSASWLRPDSIAKFKLPPEDAAPGILALAIPDATIETRTLSSSLSSNVAPTMMLASGSTSLRTREAASSTS